MGSSAWIQAARPLAQINIAIPLLVGQALAFAACGQFDWRLLVACHVFGIVDHLFIVFANDVADEAADRDNLDFTRFSGGSRVLVDGRLQRRALAIGAALMAAVLFAISIAIAVVFRRPAMMPAATAALVLLWSYSFPPLRLAYRGHGEWLQALGMGAVLPLIGFYLQCGDVSRFPWPALAPMVLLGWASHVTTAIPDRESDRRVGKKTFVVRMGDRPARKRTLLVITLAILATPWVVGPVERTTLLLVEIPPLVVLAANLRHLAPEPSPGRWPPFVLWSGAASNLVMAAWIVALFVLGRDG